MQNWPKYDMPEYDKPGVAFKDTAQGLETLRRVIRNIQYHEAAGNHREVKIFQNAAIEIIDHNNPDYIKAFHLMKRMPVTIEEFVHSEFFLGNSADVWPKLMDQLRKIKPDMMAGRQAVTEVLNSSCIGTGKSELGKISTAYDIYFLTCFREPQLLFRSLNKFTQIVFAQMSIREGITKRVLYDPLRQMIENMPYFQKHVEWNKDKDSQLELQDNIFLAPFMANTNAIIAQAIIGGHIDEANFMEVIDESKKIAGPLGQGGLYDQANEVYRTLTRRRKSRFITQGVNPGAFYVSSSVNYEDDFLNRRIREVRPQDKHIWVMNLRQFDVKPNTFSGETFRFLVGTNDWQPRILNKFEEEGIHYPRGARIENVPVEWEEDFRLDPDKAQRDMLGIASSAINRYITGVHKIVQSIQTGRELGFNSFVEKMNVQLATEGLPRIIEEYLPTDRHIPRHLHIDLSKSSDRCGIAMAKVIGRTAIYTENVVEMLPTVHIEMAVSIEPDSLHHIDIADIRIWALNLRNHYGLNIKSITYDGFQSTESQQILKKSGMNSYEISVDKTTEPYETFKQGLYQDRCILPDNPILKTELAQLEKHEKGGKVKIDHPPKGSKDIADAVAAAFYAAVMDRVTRTENLVTDTHGTPVQGHRRQANRRGTSRR